MYKLIEHVLTSFATEKLEIQAALGNYTELQSA